MNILFLTMASGIADIEKSGIYTDLMRKFRDKGHNVYIMFPLERRQNKPTTYTHYGNVHLLGVKTLNVTKTNNIEKGLGQILIEYQFAHNIKRYWRNIAFDILLYSTPPITFTTVIKDIKHSFPNAITYLLLKDIFPQNAVDLGLLKTTGIKGLLYRFFRKKENALYRLSDYIGCMSPANVEYILRHNPDIESTKVELAPNSYDVPDKATITQEERLRIREKYGLPLDKVIFIYGGNLGKPQGIPFLIECMQANARRTDCHFLVIGDGTEYPKIEAWYKKSKPISVSLFQSVPKEEYDILTSACDVGMIFLDYRFTIPNYPSRLLPYLMEKKPIIAATDPNCDTGRIAEINGYGYWCDSNSVTAFTDMVNKMLQSNISHMGERGYLYYLNNYTTSHTYNAIMKHITE